MNRIFAMPRGFDVASVKRLLINRHDDTYKLVSRDPTEDLYYDVVDMKTNHSIGFVMDLPSRSIETIGADENTAQFYNISDAEEMNFRVWYSNFFYEARIIQDKITAIWAEMEVRSVRG